MYKMSMVITCIKFYVKYVTLTIKIYLIEYQNKNIYHLNTSQMSTILKVRKILKTFIDCIHLRCHWSILCPKLLIPPLFA